MLPEVDVAALYAGMTVQELERLTKSFERDLGASHLEDTRSFIRNRIAMIHREIDSRPGGKSLLAAPPALPKSGDMFRIYRQDARGTWMAHQFVVLYAQEMNDPNPALIIRAGRLGRMPAHADEMRVVLPVEEG